MDREIEKQIINCSRCGLCMGVCPVYKAKRAETFDPRGKFLQLLGLIKGDLIYDKKIAYNMDLCLACGKCKKACPSGIDTVSILSKIRAEHQTRLERFFYSAPVFKLKMFFVKIFYKLKRRKKRLNLPRGTVCFEGCLNSAIRGGKNEFACCGLPFYVKGRLDLYEKYKARNMKLFEKYDKIVFDCASCYDTVLNYENVDKSKLVYFTDLYKNKKLSSSINCKVAFHKPCHLDEETYFDIKEILSRVKNIEFIEFEGQEECCGFGGDFFTRHGNTAIYLSGTKIQNVLKKGAGIILTTCPICLWGLKFGIKIERAKNLKALDLAEFLSGLDIKD